MKLRAMPDYSTKDMKDLRRQIGREPAIKSVGRAICPFCRHREARWRKSVEPNDVEVRILCSQCQRLGRFREEGGG